MHDFGKVVMNNETPDIFGEVIMKIYNEDVESTVAEERFTVSTILKSVPGS